MNQIKSDYSNLKTLVINLDKCVDYYNTQKPFLENIGIYSERFSAINAKNNDHLNNMYKNHISKFAYNFQPKSVIGCGLSHIMCCKYIEEKYYNDYDYFLIMEDDAYPLFNKEEFYNILNNSLYEISLLDANWDIIQLHSDAFFPTQKTYVTHFICGSTAAYLISKKGIAKMVKEKVIGHADYVQHNFIKFNKYRVKDNLFYTDESSSLNRVVNKKFSFYGLSLNSKAKILELINKYIITIPLRGEKTYKNFLEFKILKLPYMKKEYTANELLDYFFGILLFRKYMKFNRSSNFNKIMV